MLIAMTFSSYMSWDNEDEIISEEDTIAVDNNIETVEQRRASSEAQQKERIVAPYVKKQICSGRCER